MSIIRWRLLGTASGMPSKERVHSALWVETGDKNFLFDCGEGTGKQLLKYQLDGDRIDDIVISHYHPDHVTGIFMVLQMLYLQKRSKPLTIYLPERTASFKETLNLFYLFPERFGFDLFLDEVSSLGKAYPMIEAIKTNHLRGYREHVREYGLENQLTSWSFRIDTSDSCLLYTSDFNSELSDKIEEIDYLIVDALHPSYDEIMGLAVKTKKKVILTHGLSEEMKDEIDNLPPDKFIIAEDGYSL